MLEDVESGSLIGAFETEVGFRAGDRVLEVDGEKIYTLSLIHI